MSNSSTYNSNTTQMTKFSRSWKHDQVFISFRGESLRNNLVSNLIEEFKRSNINYFIDEDETKGNPITILFQRIRESGVALILFSNTYSDSYWCLDELAEIKKQVEAGNLNAFPVFYEVAAESVKRQTGSFGSYLLKTADFVRYQVDQGSYKSILETETRIWGWREALVYIGGILGTTHKKGDPEGPLISKIVVKLKKMLKEISYRKNDHFIIEKSLIHPHKAVTSLLQALNLKKSVLEDLITKPSIHSVSLRLDDLVFLDLISLKNPGLRRLTKHGQAGSIFLLLLGSFDIYDEDFDFSPILLSKKPHPFTGNKLIVSSQEIQDQSCSSPVQVTNVLAMAESNDSTQKQNRLGEDKNSNDALNCFSFLCNIIKRCAMMISPPPHRVFICSGDKQLEKNLVSSLKTELEANEISVYVENETKERIRESKVAIVVFSAKYPESPQCLDELVEIKKLMDAGEIEPFPIFYKRENVSVLAQSVKKIQGWFLNRLLKIEQEVRKDVNRESMNSILGTEARIRGWRQAILSISSRPGLSNEHSSDPSFFTDVVTKVKEMFAFKDKPKKSSSCILTNQMIKEKPLMHQQETETAITTVKSFDDDLFYSLASFLQALNLENTDLEGFREHNGLISLSLKRYPNLLCLNLGSFDNMVEFQCSKSFEFLRKGFGLNHPGISRFDEEPSRVLAIESNLPQQYHINQVQNPSSRHVASPTTPQRSLLALAPPDNSLGVADDTTSTVVVASNVATFTSTSPIEAEPATLPVTASELTTITASLNAEKRSSTNSVTLSAPISNSLTNEVEGNISGRTFEALDTGSKFEKGDTFQRTRGGRLIKPTRKVLEMQWT